VRSARPAVESAAFIQSLRSEPSLNPALVPVNGAQGGVTAAIARDGEDGGQGAGYWNYVDTRLAQARLSRNQVQVVWLKEADAGPRGSDVVYARQLAAELEGGEVERPPFWGGYRVVPEAIELWQHRANRLHVRFLYSRKRDAWTIEELQP